MIAVDFETYYARTHSVSDMGPWNYAHHPDTDIYMVSVVGEGIEFVGDPKDFDWSQLNGRDLVSHNAAFDNVVTYAGMVRKIIPGFHYRSWSCSADLAAYHGLPRSLADSTKQVFDIELPKVMRNWASGKRWSDIVEKGRGDQMLQYALDDSRHCLNLWAKLNPTWPSHERRLSAHTRSLIYRGVAIDKPKVEGAIAHLSQLKEDATNHIPWKDEKILSLAAVKDYCTLVGIPAPKSMAKDSEEAQAWEDKYGDKFPWIAALRTYRRTNMLLQKFTSLRDRCREDGTVPVGLKYWGGHTGRWSGDAGINFQNLPQGEMFGTNMRHCLVPRPGHKFVIADLSQIEPRVLAWLTKDDELLEQLRDGMPLYEAHARATMDWTGGKLKVEDPDKYRLAKARILGLGYGCGSHKFVYVAKVMAGLDLDETEAKTIVTDWRRQNRRVTKLWYDLNDRLNHAVNWKRDVLEHPLPSGRTVKWWRPRPESEDSDDIVVNQWKGQRPNYTWGGKMTENVVQALARDVFADCLLRAEAAGLRVTWSVHDELICEVPEDQAEDGLAMLLEIMSTPPEWIPDLPLAAEGSIENRYTK